MFEKLLSNLLNQHLGPYFLGFDASQLDVGVWKGRVHFENLRLKPDVIEEMGLAIEIKHGVVGKLDMDIPWKQLFPTPTKPVKIEIDQVFLVLAARPYTAKDIEKQEAREKADKKKKIEALSEPPSKGLTEPKDLSFTAKLATSIINNIQITIGKVHVRYEDSVTIPGDSYSIGITLFDLGLQSVDVNGNPAYLAGNPAVVHKKLSLGAFSVYLNRNDRPLGPLGLADCVAQMHLLTPHMRSPPGLHTYMVAPVGLNLILAINAANKPDLPKVSVTCNVTSITIALSASQYNYLLYFVDRATREATQRKFLKYKIQYSRDAKLVSPRQRWKFAIDCITEEQRRLHSLWSWRHFAGRRDARIDYVNAYTNFLKAKGKPPATLVQHLEEMEERISLEDIRAYRKMAEDRMPPEPKSVKGFFGSIFAKITGNDKESPLPAELSSSERAAIYSAINYKDDEDPSELLPSQLVVLVVNLEIEMIRFNLNREQAPPSSAAATVTGPSGIVKQTADVPPALASVVLSRLSATYRQLSKEGSMTLDASMADLAVLESISSENESILRKEVSEGTKPFVKFHLALNPVGSQEDVDTRIQLTTTAFSIYFRYWILPPLLKFLKQPDNLCLSPMADITAKTVSGLQGQSKAGIIHAITTHKTIDLQVLLGEPSIHVLLPDSQDSLDVRLGSLQARSNLVSKDKRDLLQPNVSEMDAAYDRYTVNLTGLQVSFSKDSVVRPLLEPVDINCTALQCVRDDIRGFPQYRIGVQIARIHFNFSPDGAGFAMTLADSIASGLKEFGGGDEKNKKKSKSVKRPAKDKAATPAKKTPKAHWRQTARRIRMLEAMKPDKDPAEGDDDKDGKDGDGKSASGARGEKDGRASKDGREGKDGRGERSKEADDGAAKASGASAEGKAGRRTSVRPTRKATAKDDDEEEEFFSADEEGTPEESERKGDARGGAEAQGKGDDDGDGDGDYQDVIDIREETLANPLDFMLLSATVEIDHVGITLLERDTPAFDLTIEALNLCKFYMGDQYIIADVSLQSFTFGPCNKSAERILQSVALDNGQLLTIAAKYAETPEMMKHALFENTNAAVIFAVGTLRVSLHMDTTLSLLDYINALLKAVDRAKARPAPGPLPADIPPVGAPSRPSGSRPVLLPPGVPSNTGTSSQSTAGAGSGATGSSGDGAGTARPTSTPPNKPSALAELTADPDTRPEAIFAFKVNLQFGGVELLLAYDGKPFVTAGVKGLAVTAARDPHNSLAATVQLSSIEAIDAIRNLPLLSAVDEKVLDLAVLKPSVGDGAVRLHFSRLHCLVIFASISNIANFAGHLMQSALLKKQPSAALPPSPSPPPSDTEDEGGAAPASFSAKDITSTMFWNIDVSIGAPTFLLPVNPDDPASTSAFEAQLGSLTVSNTRQSYSDPQCTLDEITVRLDQFQLTAKEGDVVTRHLLQPSSIEVGVYRCLGVTPGVPDMRIEASLNEIMIRVRDADLAMVQHTLNGNLKGPQYVPKPLTDEEEELAVQPIPQPDSRRSRGADDDEDGTSLPIAIAAHASFKLFKVVLLNKDAAIAEFTMAGLDAGFIGNPGQHMRCRVVLDEISLCDVRATEQKSHFPYMFSKDAKMLEAILKKNGQPTPAAAAPTAITPANAAAAAATGAAPSAGAKAERSIPHLTKTEGERRVIAAEAAAAGNPDSNAVLTTDKPAAARVAKKLAPYGTSTMLQYLQAHSTARTRHTEVQDPSLFELYFVMDDGDQQLNANVAPIRVTFCADFYIALIAMFATFINKPDPEPTSEIDEEADKKNKRIERARREAEVAQHQQQEQQEVQAPKRKGKMMVRASLQGIKATIYSDPTNINSYGVRVGLAGDLTYGYNESQDNLIVKLRDLRLSSRRPLDQSYHLSDVLAPTELQLTVTKRLGSPTTETGILEVPKLAIRVGYYDVVCVKEVISSVTSKFQQEVAINKRELHFGTLPVKPKWYTHLSPAHFRHRPSNAAITAPAAAAVTASATATGSTGTTPRPPTTLEVHLEQLDILVVDDSGVADKRLLSLTTTLDLELAGISLLGIPTTGDLQVLMSLYLAAACYNDNVSAWEPIIDPDYNPMTYKSPDYDPRRSHMWCVVLRLDKSTKGVGATEIAVESVKHLQLTITHHFLSSTLNSAFFRLLGSASSGKRAPSTSELPPMATLGDSAHEHMPSQKDLDHAPPAIAAAAVAAASAPSPALAPASVPVSLGKGAQAIAFPPEATTHDSVPVAPTSATFAALAAASGAPGSLASSAKATVAPTALTAPHHTKQQTHVPYLTVKNCSGVACVLATRVSGMDAVEVAADATVQVTFTDDLNFSIGKPLQDVAEKRSISLQFQDARTPLTLYTELVGKYGFPIMRSGIESLLVADISTTDSGRLIVLRSSYVLRNESDVALDVFVRMPGSQHSHQLTTIEPGHFYSLPMLYVRLAEVRVRLAALPCLESREALDLRSPYQVLSCPSEVDPARMQPFNVIARIEEEVYENFDDKKVINSPHHVVTFSSPITLRNDLPVAMVVHQVFPREAQFTLEPDECVQLRDAEIHATITVPGVTENASNTLSFSAKDPKRTTNFRITDQGHYLQIAVHYENEHMPGQPLSLRFYSPYWLVNRTGRNINFRETMEGRTGVSFAQSAESRDPLLFCFSSTDHRQHLSFKLDGTEWSAPVNMSVVGHNDTVTLARPAACDWLVTVKSYLAANGLTKIVLLQPYYILVNKCEAPVTISESATGGPAVTVAAGQAEPYWPAIHSSFVCRHDEDLCSPHLIHLDTPSTFSLPYRHPAAPDTVVDVMDVSIRAEDVNTFVIFSDNPGRCDVRIENRSSSVISFRQPSQQPDHAPLHHLAPHSALFYYRDEPQGPMGLQVLQANKQWMHLSYEEFLYKPMAENLWYLCFPDGTERVLVFVDQREMGDIIALASGVQTDGSVTLSVGDSSTTSISITLQAIYLSIISAEPREIVLLSITPRIVWQYELAERNAWGDRWERLDAETRVKLTKAKEKEKDPTRDKPVKPVSVRKHVEINVNTMEMITMTKGGPQATRVRSRVAPGVMMTLFDNGQQALVRLYIEHLQIDNEMPGALTPVILTSSHTRDRDEASPTLRVLVHKSTAALEGERAATMIHRIAVDLQPLAVMADDTFVTALIEMIPVQNKDVTATTLTADLEYVRDFTIEPTIKPKTDFIYFKLLQINDINADISFFIVGQDTKDHPSPVTKILKAVGLALTNIDGIPFHLNSLELQDIFCASSELSGLLLSHYKFQAVREIFKVFGCLDIIGNPVKFFGHLNTGFSDLTRKGDIFEGVLSLASNTVAGASGAVAGITGSIGNSIATLSMDDEYRRKRMEDKMMHRTASDQMLLGGKRMVEGFADGLTGMVSQPLEGAKKDGALGFFKGVGKGLLGVVAKPVAGILDMTSSTANAVQTAAGDNRVHKRLRAPRFIRPDKIVPPFLEGDTIACDMLQHSELLQPKEVMWTHYFIQSAQQIFFFTSRALIMTSYVDHKLRLMWKVPWDSILAVNVQQKGLEIVIRGADAREQRILVPMHSLESGQLALAASRLMRTH